MKNYYAVLSKEKKEPIAIFENLPTALKYKFSSDIPYRIEKYPKNLKHGFTIEQPEGTPIGEFSNLEYASKFLKGSFKSSKVWN